MSTHTFLDHADGDTLRVSRPAPAPAPAPARPASPRRLAEMDLDPPPGPVPADVLAYFERAVENERRRQAA
ncbi:hypothetical protein [Miltoncostaea marina]|uniref:hypothetical protein n=1 Tax=Miltoncostaea marina TaxID=2843215 RepID=UPI001C3D7908|nr:hypothetical protein [Miltoncostaea marina]